MEIKIAGLKQSLDLMSDDLTVESPDIAAFKNETENWAVKFGYEGKNIDFGSFLADDWRLTRIYNNFTCSVQARDKLKKAIDKEFQKVYFLTEPSEAPKNEFNEELTYVSGYSPKASQVALDACTAAGLGLVWQCMDYDVISDVEGEDSVGYYDSVANVLKELVDKVQYSELYKIDIFIKDTTVYVKEREYPITTSKIASISLDDVRIMSLSLNKSNKERKVRHIYVSTDNPASMTEDSNTVVRDTKDKYGNVIAREQTTTYTVNGITTKIERKMYRSFGADFQRVDFTSANGLYMVEDTVTIFEYENTDGSLEPFKTPYQKPVLVSKDSKFYAYSAVLWTAGTQRETVDFLEKESHSETTYTYDDNILLKEITNDITRDWLQPGTPETRRMTITEYRKLTKDLVQTVTTQYINELFDTQDIVTQAGQMPGIRKIGQQQRPELWFKKITVNVNGDYDIKYHNNYMTVEQLEVVAARLKTEAELTKYELQLSIIPMPWLRKGMALKLTGNLKDGMGPQHGAGENDPNHYLALDNFVWTITAITHSRTDNGYTGTLTAVAWL